MYHSPLWPTRFLASWKYHKTTKPGTDGHKQAKCFFFIRQASSILLGGFCVKQQHFNTMQQWTSASLSQLPSEMPFWYSYPPKGVDKGGGGIFAYMHLTTSHPPHSYKHVYALPCTREGTFSTMWKYTQSAANSLTTDNYRRPPLLGSESGTKSIQVHMEKFSAQTDISVLEVWTRTGFEIVRVN